MNISKEVWMGATYGREEGASADSMASLLVLCRKKSEQKETWPPRGCSGYTSADRS